MAPPNDTRATAEQLTVGSYWGVASGTTVDATEDAGGPVDGWGAKDVFYYWDDLPAGQIFIYIRPTNDTIYLEAAVVDKAPAGWVSADTWTGFGWTDGPSNPCMFVAQHPGGPASLVVYTYDPDETGFDFGWGHSDDADPSHWGTDQSEDWDSHAGDALAPTTETHGGVRLYSALSASPVGLDTGRTDCAYTNARSGVVSLASGTDPKPTPCSYVGPGSGHTIGSLPPVGQAHQGVKSNTILGPTPHSRMDEVYCHQETFGVWLGEAGTGEVEPDTEPDTFDTYAAANGRPDGLVWGWQYTDDQYEVRNVTFRLNVTQPTVLDVEDPCTVTFRALSQDEIYPNASLGSNANRVALSTAGVPTSNWVEPEYLGSEILAIDDGENTYVIADPTPWLRHSADDAHLRWLPGVLISEETLAGDPPTYQDEGWAQGERDVGVVAIDGETAWFESRVPPWRPYIGFPLEVQLGGWHIGRSAMTTSGAW